MRIGIAQIDTRPGDFARTCERMRSYASLAADQGVDLLVFPAPALTGGEGVRESDLTAYLLDLMEALAGLADQVACPCLVTVHVGPSDLVVPQSLLVYQGKVSLLGMPSAYVRQDGTEGADGSGPALSPDDLAGQALATFTVAGERVALAHSADDLDLVRRGGADVSVIVYLAEEGVCVDDPSTALAAALQESRFASDAQAAEAWLVAVGGVGAYGELVYGGSSFVLAPDGRLVAEARDFEEDFITCEVGRTVQVDEAEVLAEEVFDPTLYLWQTLVLGLQDIVEKFVDADQVVLPLDGTLSASLLALLASDALGPVRVHALLCAPDEASDRRVRALAQRLRLDVRDLGEASGLLAGAGVAGAAGGGGDDALGRAADLSDLARKSLASAQMAVWAGQLHAAVLSPADKTQIALGTDAQVPLSAVAMPLGDVYRSDVIDLARLRNTISPVMESVAFTSLDLPRVPGARLPAGSLDDQVYAVDSVLLEHLEGGHGVRDVAVVTGREVRFADAVLARLNATEASRCALPLVISTSSTPLAYATAPLGLAWRPNTARDDQDCQNDLERLVTQRLRLPQLAAGTGGGASAGAGQGDRPPAGTEAPQPEVEALDEDDAQELREILSFLADYLQEGGFDQEEGSGLRAWLEAAQAGDEGSGGSGRPGGLPPFWGPPFSEN